MEKKKYNWHVYTPKNKEKYRGKKDKEIMTRSGWEYSFCEFLDNNPIIKIWGSEPFAIPYFSKTYGITRNYYPDFLVMTEKETFLIEIKPSRETQKPKKSKKKKRSTLLYEEATYITNQSKWEAAKKLCNFKKWTFFVLTEKNEFKGFRIKK